MSRVFALFVYAVLALSFGTASVAHATEPLAICVPTEDAGSLHFPGDADEVPADDAKGYPHHHGGCAGHQIATPAEQRQQNHAMDKALQPLESPAPFLAAAPIDMTLRPPIA